MHVPTVPGRLVAWLAALLTWLPLTGHAAVILVSDTELGPAVFTPGATTWERAYTVVNDSPSVTIEELTIWFDRADFEVLALVAAGPGWDALVIQPDPALPDDGFLDAIAVPAGIPPGGSLGDLAVQFDYLGPGAPTMQSFVVVDPTDFRVLEEGVTTVVPLPGGIGLLATALGGLLLRARRRAGRRAWLAGFPAALAAFLLAGCAGGSDGGTPATLAGNAGTPGAGPRDEPGGAADTVPVPIRGVGLVLESSRRVGRTLFEYSYRIDVVNLDVADRVVTAFYTSSSGATEVIDGQADFGLVPGLGGARSSDTITIRQDRQQPFDPASLLVTFSGDAAVEVTREPAQAAASIEPLGGDIVATASNGTAISLSVPPAAFAGGVIQLTPVSAVQGLVVSPAVVAAVELLPAGTTFARAATVSFSPPAGQGFGGPVVGFRLVDERLEWLPATLNADGTASIPVAGFSIYGLVQQQATETLLQSQSTAALRSLDLRVADFLEWTKKFFERDFDYFPARQASGLAPPYAYPDCNIAETAAREVIGFGQLEDLLGTDLSRTNAAEGRLAELLVGMAEQADFACDDDLWFRCFGTAQRFAGLTRSLVIGICAADGVSRCDSDADCDSAGVGGACEFGVEITGGMLSNKRCGIQAIDADPEVTIAGLGETSRFTFTARDASGTAVDRPLALLDLSGAGSPTVNSVATPDPGVLTLDALCRDVGSTDYRVFDEGALNLGAEISVTASIACSAGGLRIEPGRRVVIGGDRARFEAVLLDVAGNPVPITTNLPFQWTSFFPTLGDVGLEVIPDPNNRSRATAFFPLRDGILPAPVVVAACLPESLDQECFTEPVSAIATAEFQAVPDLRGTWFGRGSYVAAGCQDESDDGDKAITDWQLQVTQGLLPGSTVSNIAGAFGGRGIGERVLGDVIGTMGETGAVVGIADYEAQGTGATGSAQFSGGTNQFSGGNLGDLRLEFTFADETVDTCRGAGLVEFVLAP